MNKERILSACAEEINDRLNHTQAAIDSARESANSEQKSTAGDKHDTARAMAQFEQEKLSKQLSEQLKLKEMLSRIQATSDSLEIRMGSLASCSNGLFFLGIGLGKIEVDSTSVFCVSLASPIGKALIGKKSGEEFSVNGRSFNVLDVT